MARTFASGQKIQFDNPNIGVANPITVAAWVRLTTLDGGGNAIISYGDKTARGWMLSITSGSRLEIRSTNGSAAALNGPTSISTNTWYHVAWTGTANGGNTDLRIYLDGVSEGTSFGASHAAPNSTDDIAIGTAWLNDNTGRANWTGQIAEVFIWNAVLSADELVSVRRGRGYNLRPSSLLLYAPLWGVHSAEPNLAGSSVTGTVTSATRGDDPPIRLFTPADGSFEEIAAAPAGGQPGFVRSRHIPGMRSGGYRGIFR